MSGEVKNLKRVEKEFKLNDGEVIKLVINFGLLYQLRAKKKDVYEKYSQTILMGSKDIFDFIQIIYVGYLCANINEIDSCMSFETFAEKMPVDITEIVSVAQELTQPKKK